MKILLFGMKDIKTGFFDPMTFRSAELAKSEFVAFLNELHHSSDARFAPPSDLQLWELGEFDLDSGFIVPRSPKLLVSGDSVIFKEDSDEE